MMEERNELAVPTGQGEPAVVVVSVPSDGPSGPTGGMPRGTTAEAPANLAGGPAASWLANVAAGVTHGASGVTAAERIRAALGAARAAWDGHWALRRQRIAFRELGDALTSIRRPSSQAAPGSIDAAALEGAEIFDGPALEKVLELDAQREKLVEAARASLDRDRADYALVPPWGRAFVIARGLFDRAAIGSRRLHLRRLRRAACEELGRLAHAQIAGGEQGPDAAEAAAAHARATAVALETAREERRRLLEKAGAYPVAAVLPVVGREASAVAASILRELRGQMIPRVPALAGLAVGWWIANTFTDSSFKATLHNWGIGSGPRHAIDSGTYRAMAFWLPLVAAAFCSYACSRLADVIRKHYARPEQPGESAKE
jgi:hypothetical protein